LSILSFLSIKGFPAADKKVLIISEKKRLDIQRSNILNLINI
jgi:hypothetical protein